MEPNPPNAGAGASFGVVDPNAIFGFGSSFSSSRPRFDLTLPKAKDGALSFWASFGFAGVGAELAPPKLNAGVAGAPDSPGAAGAAVLPNLSVEDDDPAGVVAAGVLLEDDPPNEKAGFLLLDSPDVEDPPKEIECCEVAGSSEDESPLWSRRLFGLDSATSPSSGFAGRLDPKEKVALTVAVLAGARGEDDVEPKVKAVFLSSGGIVLSPTGTGAPKLNPPVTGVFFLPCFSSAGLGIVPNVNAEADAGLETLSVVVAPLSPPKVILEVFGFESSSFFSAATVAPKVKPPVLGLDEDATPNVNPPVDDADATGAALLPNVKPLEDIDDNFVEEAGLEAPPKEKPLEPMDADVALDIASLDEVLPLALEPGRRLSQDTHLFTSLEFIT